jgi:hypothetical protein
MAIREPLKSFAERLVRNGEVYEFFQALVESGVDKTTLDAISRDILITKESETTGFRRRHDNPLDRFTFVDEKHP